MIDVDYTKYIDYKVLLSSTEGISLRDFLISLNKCIQLHTDASGSFYVLSAVIRNSQV